MNMVVLIFCIFIFLSAFWRMCDYWRLCFNIFFLVSDVINIPTSIIGQNVNILEWISDWGIFIYQNSFNFLYDLQNWAIFICQNLFNFFTCLNWNLSLGQQPSNIYVCLMKLLLYHALWGSFRYTSVRGPKHILHVLINEESIVMTLDMVPSKCDSLDNY